MNELITNTVNYRRTRVESLNQVDQFNYPVVVFIWTPVYECVEKRKTNTIHDEITFRGDVKRKRDLL